MSSNPIRFDDGAAYERMMGVWSRKVGEEFLDWLAPPEGLRWADIGCGNGAFTELLVERCAPREVVGIDPSAGQLDFARQRHVAGTARFAQGDAMALDLADASVDAAVMALVLFFVPDPARGLAEMQRIVCPGGLVSAYVWDLLEPDGFPMAAMQQELRDMGVELTLPPSAEISRLDALESLWREAGLSAIATRQITVERSFDDFDDYWANVLIALGMTPAASAGPALRDELRARLDARMPRDADGRVSYSARANAVKGVA